MVGLNLSYYYRSLGAKAGDSPTGDSCEPSSNFAVGVGYFAPTVFSFLFGLSVNYADGRLLLSISSGAFNESVLTCLDLGWRALLKP